MRSRPVHLALGRILPVGLRFLSVHLAPGRSLPVELRFLSVHLAPGRILPVELRLLSVQLSHISHLVRFTEGPETGLVAVVVTVDPWFLSFLSVHIVLLSVHFVFLPVLLIFLPVLVILPVRPGQITGPSRALIFLPVHPFITGPSTRVRVRPSVLSVRI